MRRLGSTLCIATLSWLTGMALPATSKADIVLHDGGVSRDKDAAERVTDRTGTAPTLILSSEVLSGPTRLLAGHAQVEQCEGAPIPLDIEGKLQEIEDAVFSYELETAIRALDILSTLTPCASTPIKANSLARMSFLRGATLLDMGDSSAERSMAEALGFVTDYGGERGFPKAHGEMLEAARRRIKPLPDGRLFIWAGPGAETIYVDGVERQQAHSAGVVARPGLHLVQILKDGELKGMWVRIRSRFSALILPNAGRAVWADAGRTPGGEQAMSLMLTEEFRGQQGDIHILHYRGRLISASSWPAVGEGHKRWQLRAGATGRRKKLRKRDAKAATQQAATTSTTAAKEDPVAGASATVAPQSGSSRGQKIATKSSGPDTTTATAAPTSSGSTQQQSSAASKPGLILKPKSRSYEERRLRLALGAGFHYADPFAYALLAIDVSYQFFGPLHAVLILRPSLGEVAEFPTSDSDTPIVGPVAIAPIGLGIGVQRVGRLAPYGRIVGQYAHNRDGLSTQEHLGGVAIQGGLDFPIRPDKGFIARVQGEAGFIGSHFNGRVWAGVGLNL